MFPFWWRHHEWSSFSIFQILLAPTKNELSFAERKQCPPSIFVSDTTHKSNSVWDISWGITDSLSFHRVIRRLWRQEQVSQAGIIICIPQYSMGSNCLSVPELPGSDANVLIYHIPWICTHCQWTVTCFTTTSRKITKQRYLCLELSNCLEFEHASMQLSYGSAIRFVYTKAGGYESFHLLSISSGNPSFAIPWMRNISRSLFAEIQLTSDRNIGCLP